MNSLENAVKCNDVSIEVFSSRSVQVDLLIPQDESTNLVVVIKKLVDDCDSVYITNTCDAHSHHEIVDYLNEYLDEDITQEILFNIVDIVDQYA